MIAFGAPVESVAAKARCQRPTEPALVGNDVRTNAPRTRRPQAIERRSTHVTTMKSNGTIQTNRHACPSIRKSVV